MTEINWFGMICIQIVSVGIFIACAMAPLRIIPEEIEGARWKRILGWALYGLESILLPSLFYNDVVTISTMTVTYVLIGRLLYFRNKMGLVCQIIYCAVMLGTQYMGIGLGAYLFVRFPMELYTYLIVIAVMKNFLLILGTILLCQMMRRRFADVRSLKIRGMVLVPVFSMILMFLYLISGEVFFLRYGYHWVLVFCILVLVINVYCLYFWYDVAKNRELRHRLNLMQQQNELTLQYYEEMEDNYNHSRKIIHDMRNHLHAMSGKYRIENSEYMEDMHSLLNSLGMKFYTENRMLNIVLNDKLRQIPPGQVDCNLGGVDFGFISEMDTTTIFANLLDNALEARAGTTDFRLQIRGEEIQDFTVVKITNPAGESYKEGVSTKPGHEGLGLQNVRQALEKYAGEMQVDCRDGIFSVTLLFAKHLH